MFHFTPVSLDLYDQVYLNTKKNVHNISWIMILLDLRFGIKQMENEMQFWNARRHHQSNMHYISAQGLFTNYVDKTTFTPLRLHCLCMNDDKKWTFYFDRLLTYLVL